jgi:hypothetical protein
MRAFFLAQQKPIVVDLAKQSNESHDISIDVVLGMFAMAGVLLLIALIGCAIVAGGMILYKRWRDASAPPAETQHTHTRLFTN